MAWLDKAIRVVRDFDESRPRSQQADLGWSEVGGCRAYMGYRLDGAFEEETDKWAALRGTAIDQVYGPVLAAGLGALYQAEVTYRGIPGHADLIHSLEDWVTDMKAPELGNAKAWQADVSALWQKRVQNHGYAAGAIEAGLLTEQCTVRLLIMPSGGTFGDWWVYEEPFNRDIADAGAERLADVRARQEAGASLQRDKPYQWCKDWCGFFALCRKPEDDGELDEITDPEIATAVARYGELLEITGPAEREKKALASLIRGYTAQARGWRVSTGKPGDDRRVLDEAAIRATFAEWDMEVPEKAQPALDEDAVRAAYEAWGMEVPEVVHEGRAAALRVTRIKEPKAAKPAKGEAGEQGD